MKPFEMLGAILRAAGVLSLINSPPMLLTGQPGPLMIAGYQTVVGIVLIIYGDSIAQWCYRKRNPEL